MTRADVSPVPGEGRWPGRAGLTAWLVAHPRQVPPGPEGEPEEAAGERPVVLLLAFLCHKCPTHGWSVPHPHMAHPRLVREASVLPGARPGEGLLQSRGPRPPTSGPPTPCLAAESLERGPVTSSEDHGAGAVQAHGCKHAVPARGPKAPSGPGTHPCPTQLTSAHAPDTQPTLSEVHSAPKARSGLAWSLGLHAPTRPGSSSCPAPQPRPQQDPRAVPGTHHWTPKPPPPCLPSAQCTFARQPGSCPAPSARAPSAPGR